MELTVLVEHGGDGYTARDPFGRTASAPTAWGAVDALRAALAAAAGELVPVVVTAEHPLTKWAGTWQGDPRLDEFHRAVERHRQERDTASEEL